MAAKYSQAPISEVICGVFFQSKYAHKWLRTIFNSSQNLQPDYPIINTHPTPLPEEEVINGMINANPHYQAAGFSTYRFATLDGRWQVLIQQNMLSLHWNRKDSEAVGQYPGFSEVYQKFKGLFNNLLWAISSDDGGLLENIKSCYLAYVDRVDIENFNQRGEDINDILTLNPPGFSGEQKEYKASNYFARYSTLCDDVNGFSIMSINSPTIAPIGQILIVDNKVRGAEIPRPH